MFIKKIFSLFITVSTSVVLVARAQDPIPPPSNLPQGPFYVLDPNQFVDRFPGGPEEFDWAQTMIPFIDLPIENYSEILTSYYYRARSYRSHVHYTGEEDGFVVTEFGPNVGWAGKHNTISAAAGHHILEGRWFRDERILDDYVRFWFKEGGGKDHIASYSVWILTAAWQRSLITGNRSALLDIFDSAADAYVNIYTEEFLSNS